MKKYLTILITVITVSFKISAQEQRSFSGLLKPDEKRLKRVPHAASASARPGVSLQDSIDLFRMMPLSGDQGYQGSCAAFTVVYDCLSYLENRRNHTNPVVNGSNDSSRIYSPKYLFNVLKMRNASLSECRTGVFFTDILNAVVEKGSPPLSQLPYIGTDSLDCTKPIREDELAALAQDHRMAGYDQKYYDFVYDVKADLNDGSPIMFGMDVDTDFTYNGYKCARENRQFIYKFNPSKPHTYHALIVVGYNDATRLFKILNSWGTNWGNKGYFYMTYEDFMNSKYETFTAKAGTTTAIAASALVNNAPAKIKLGVNGRYQGYFRLGFYKKFENFNIGINFINKNIGEVIVSVLSPEKNNVLASIILLEDQTKYFYYQKQKINITFAGIDIDGISSAKNDVLLTIKISKDGADPLVKKLLEM